MKQYQRLFEMENVRLTFSEEALRLVARKGIQRKTGARGLRSILEGMLLETMFELPNLRGVEEVVINGEVVEGRAKPLSTSILIAAPEIDCRLTVTLIFDVISRFGRTQNRRGGAPKRRLFFVLLPVLLKQVQLRATWAMAR